MQSVKGGVVRASSVSGGEAGPGGMTHMGALEQEAPEQGC